jgi:membrane-bound serine protease (ClpP class)
MKTLARRLGTLWTLMLVTGLAGAAATLAATEAKDKPNEKSEKADEAAKPAPVPTRADAPWLQVDIGTIGAASEDILKTAIEEAKRRDCAGLVVRLDTPGGALDATRNMVKDIMAAPFPVFVWVGPGGSRAGSAGAFITIAGHVAAMAPGTNIGASHPIDASGKDVGKGELDRKITNDTVAFIESIAKTRGRNVEMARSFVETSVSITDAEALDHGVIDLVAKDVPALMAAADGRIVELSDARRLELATKDAVVLPYEKTLRQRLLEVLSNPNLFYLLFMAGLLGIGYELTHPGVIFPGVVGAICMILALIATSVLPVSWGAGALVLVGVALLVAEAFVTSYGILGVGGLVAVVLGSVFLVDPTGEMGLRISWLAIAPGALVIGGGFLALGFLVLRSGKAPVLSGKEALVGAEGVVLGDFVGGDGQIRVAGAIWAAHVGAASPRVLKKGDRVVVRKVDGLKVEV